MLQQIKWELGPTNINEDIKIAPVNNLFSPATSYNTQS